MWGGQSCPQLSHTCQPHMKGYPAGSLCPYLARLQRSWLAHDGDRIQIHNCTRNYYVLPLLDLPLCQRGCLIQPLQPCYRRPGCTAVSAAGSRCCSRPQPAAEEGREGLQQAAGGRSCSRLLLVAEGGREGTAHSWHARPRPPTRPPGPWRSWAAEPCCCCHCQHTGAQCPCWQSCCHAGAASGAPGCGVGGSR